MENKSLETLTESQRKLHNEFIRCQNRMEIEKFLEKVEILNESQENNEIPYYDMTTEEYCKKYNLVPIEEVIEQTVTGIKGIGGCETRGKFRWAMPKSMIYE
jgi:hypothetical protein